MRADQNKTKRQLAAHVEYTSVVNCLGGKKSTRCSRGIWNFSLCIKVLIYYYSTISCRKHENFLRIPGWETLDFTTGWVAEESGFDS